MLLCQLRLDDRYRRPFIFQSNEIRWDSKWYHHNEYDISMQSRFFYQDFEKKNLRNAVLVADDNFVVLMFVHSIVIYFNHINFELQADFFFIMSSNSFHQNRKIEDWKSNQVIIQIACHYSSNELYSPSSIQSLSWTLIISIPIEINSNKMRYLKPISSSSASSHKTFVNVNTNFFSPIF